MNKNNDNKAAVKIVNSSDNSFTDCVDFGNRIEIPVTKTFEIMHYNRAAIRTILVLLVMFYVPLCQFVFQYFDCTQHVDGTWTLDMGMLLM